MPTAKERSPKHQQVRGELEREIRAGRWRPGDRLPSEVELGLRFGASRITIGRAMRDLQLAGLVDRRAGSGSFVRAGPPPGALSFGLLIPDLGQTEVFEPICQGIMSSPLASQHALVWGGGTAPEASREERAWALCRQYVARKLSGVFFAPIEHSPSMVELNRRITGALDEAGIPVVLLDRTAVPHPERGRHDLVGLDHRLAGFTVTAHLAGLGARRVGFVGLPGSAASVDLRQAGYREALEAAGLSADATLARRLDPTDPSAVRQLLQEARPEALVAANDWTAARLLQTLLGLGCAVPGDVRLVGIDDLPYAALLPVPLTTLRQPTAQIGAAALAAMLDRVGGAGQATRDVLLHGALVVRRSCGSGTA